MNYEYYCSKCFSKCDKKIDCTSCGKGVALYCLVKMALRNQIETIMKREWFYEKRIPLEERFTSTGLCHLFDGKFYKEQVANGTPGPLPYLTCTWYTDGAALFKPSKVSVRLLFLSINELPYSERYTSLYQPFAVDLFSPQEIYCWSLLYLC